MGSVDAVGAPSAVLPLQTRSTVKNTLEIVQNAKTIRAGEYREQQYRELRYELKNGEIMVQKQKLHRQLSVDLRA